MGEVIICLTEAERAYRRGCVDALHFAIAGMPLRGTAEDALLHLARWREALLAGQDSTDPAYLGRYLDTVRKTLEQGG